MQGSTACRGALAGVLSALALGAVAPTALAATISGNDNYFFNAVGGETNVVTITRSGNTVTFDDAGSDLTDSSPDCVEGAGDVVTCTAPADTPFSVSASLGDNNDTATLVAPAEPTPSSGYFATVSGDEGDDTLNGSVDGAALSGGDGNDTINGGDNPENDGDDLDGGPGNDTIRGGAGEESFSVNDPINPGAGDDTVDAGPGDDQVLSSPGNDTQAGGDGEDSFFTEGAGTGTDLIRGDGGIDNLTYTSFRFTAPSTNEDIPLTVTLDGQANDGVAGENDNAQVEDVFLFDQATNVATNSLTGDAGSNNLSGTEDNDVIDGAGGNDILAGNGGDDTIRARDGFADRVFCGTGRDTVTADAFDTVSSGCEVVDAAQTPFATEDKPPSIAFVSPAAGAKLNTAAPTPITVTATDDKAIARVLLIDDGQIVGQATAPPYTINYQPRGGDVGKNQLAVVAVDSTEQTATAFRTVTVDRFTPRSVSVSFKPSRDRTLPFRFTTSGKVNLPASGLVTRAQGCKGIVSVQVKKGSKTISTRRATLRSNCTYSSTVVFRDTERTGRRGTLKVTVRFLGNEVLARRSASARNFRVGR